MSVELVDELSVADFSTTPPIARVLSLADVDRNMVMVIGKEMSQRARTEGNKAVEKDDERNNRCVTAVVAAVAQATCGARLTKQASMYLTSVLDYTMCRLLEAAGDRAQEDAGRIAVTCQDVISAIRGDAHTHACMHVCMHAHTHARRRQRAERVLPGCSVSKSPVE